MRGKQYHVYILTNYTRTVLYIGITNDLIRRTWEHKQNLVKGFTQKYHVHFLVFHEVFDDPQLAIEREKQLKSWHREWKINLIKEKNPEFKDLYEALF